MNFIEGPAIIWDPKDRSIESYLLGQLLFGDYQHAIRRDAEKRPVKGGSLVITKVDPETRSITVSRL